MKSKPNYPPHVVRLTIVVGIILFCAMIFRRWMPSAEMKPDSVDSVTWLPSGSESFVQPHFEMSAAPRQTSTDSLRNGITNFITAMQTEMDHADDVHLSEKQKEDLQKFVAGLDVADVPQAAQLLQRIFSSNPTAAGRNLQMQLLGRWTELAPTEALDWANATLTGRSRESFLDHMAGTWARSDMPKAIVWARQLPQGVERDSILTRIADEGAPSDPVGALSLASTLPASFSRDELVVNAAGQWANLSAKDAVAWAARIPDENLKAKVTSAIAVGWANTDPAAAARLVIDSLPAGAVQRLTTLAIVERFAQIDMVGASEWVSGLPEGDLRAGAQESLREVSARAKLLERYR